MEEKNSATAGVEGEEKNDDLQKRVPNKAEWLLKEESRRKKVYRSSVLGKLTTKTNALKTRMEERNQQGVQVLLEEWQQIYCDLEEANGDYHATLDSEQLKEDISNWARPHFDELDQFKDRVLVWISMNSEKEEPVVRPSDSISQTGSRISSTASSAKLSAKLRRAELAAKAAALEERAKLQERELQIKEQEFQIKKDEMEVARQREMLEVKMEMAQEEAKLQVLDEFERTEAVVPENVKPETVEPRRTPIDARNLNPEARDFHPTLHYRNERKGPTPEEFLQGLVSTQTEVTKLMVDHNKQASLPTRAISVFDGDPLKYTTFVRAFKHAIEDKTSDAEDRLSYLQQYTRGEPKKIVDSCFLMEPEEGFRTAKESLQERYGTPHKISRAYSVQASKWPEIKAEDKTALKDFVLFLMECKNAMSGDRYLRELDNYYNIKLLVDKLPFKLKERWRRRSHEIIKERPVSFSDFVSFVKKEEDVVSNEVFGDLGNREGSRGSGFKRGQGPRRGSSLAVAVATGGAEAGSAGGCLYCAQANHGLSHCGVLGARPVAERLQYIRDRGLCFGCLGKAHMAKECKQRATCGKCQRSHPTVLHREVGTLPKKTAAVGRVLRNGRSWEGVPPIIPVKVRSKTTNITVETYAFLDSGSDVVFCTEALKDQLKTSGRKTKLTLNTINDTKAVHSEVLHDLEVMDLKGENTIPIATAYTQGKIPASKENIVSTKDLKAWPHLKEVDVPKINADIGLLIGNNVPKAVEPWQVINSQGDGPYAVRSLLGWSVNGPLKGASDDKATVNRISLDQQLTEYFNGDFNETKEDKKEMSVEDQRFMKIVSEGTRKEDGHYQIPLPFKRGPPELPNNKQVALQRANHLKKRMTKDERIPEKHVKSWQKWEAELELLSHRFEVDRRK
ncbi:uncharacterized protein LOC144886352 [Branchiostoma floridae x Branchiostoma japonicum]